MTDISTDVADKEGDVKSQNAEADKKASTPTPAETPAVEKPDESKPEVKPADDKANKPAESEVEPEAIEVKVPEALNFDDSTVTKLNDTARDLKLTPEQTQGLLDAIAPEIVREQQGVLEAMRADWANEIANDSELGGAKLEANVALAGQVVDSYGDAALKDLLDAEEAPLGKHPAMFRFLAKLGAVTSADVSVNPGITGDATKTNLTKGDVSRNPDAAAKALYPKEQK